MKATVKDQPLRYKSINKQQQQKNTKDTNTKATYFTVYSIYNKSTLKSQKPTSLFCFKTPNFTIFKQVTKQNHYCQICSSGIY